MWDPLLGIFLCMFHSSMATTHPPMLLILPTASRCPVHSIPLLPFTPHASPNALSLGHFWLHHLALWSLVDFQLSRSQFKPKGLTRLPLVTSYFTFSCSIFPQSLKAHPCGCPPWTQRLHPPPLCLLQAVVPAMREGNSAALQARPSPEVALFMDNPEVFLFTHAFIPPFNIFF